MASVGSAASGRLYNQADRTRTWLRRLVHANGALPDARVLIFSFFLLCFTHGQEVMSVPVTWETETVAKIPRQWVLVSELFPFAQTDTGPSVAAAPTAPRSCPPRHRHRHGRYDDQRLSRPQKNLLPRWKLAHRVIRNAVIPAFTFNQLFSHPSWPF